MKLCRLKLKNLNSFRGEQEIDFESGLLSDAALVAITGPTGAGKTTLLDAICVALYGKTPRLSGTGSQHARHLISHGEKEGFAEVHFMANATRYVAVWSLRRGSSAEVRLSYAEDNKLISDKLSSQGKTLGSSQRAVSEEVESILGLDFNAFRRSVMLAQGEFAAFLKAKQENRRQILEATAGIRIYDLLRQALNDKVKEVEAANADVLDKLNKIPEASQEQLTEAEAVFGRLQSEAETVGARSQHIQDKKRREEKRKEDYEKLQSSKERRNELANQQPEIDTLQTTLENANRAQRLLSEKQMYDTATSDFEGAEKALRVATVEKTEAEGHVKSEQTVYDEKEKVYQTTSDEHAQKMPLYRNAKLDVARAADQFAEADKRTVGLGDLDDEIDPLSEQLTNSETEQTELQRQIEEVQTFLEKNPLPADRHQRLNRATGLLTQLTSHETQLETTLASKVQSEKNMSSLKQEIDKLSDTHKKRLAEKTEAETALKTAITELDNLQTAGTREEWDTRKQQASRAYPIVQGYEEGAVDGENILEQVNELHRTLSKLNRELVQIEAELREQTEICRHAAETVERCEEALRSEMLTNPINQLRQHLHTGEPCLVCGSTDHPYAGVVESENEERRQDAENALDTAKAEAQAAQDRMQVFKTKQMQTEHDSRNAVNQSEELTMEAGALRDKKEVLDRQWKEMRPDLEASFDSIVEQDVDITVDWDSRAD